MALFTDGPISGTIEIQDYDNSILQIVSAENIDLNAKARLAQEEIASELTLFLLRRLPGGDPQWTVRQKVGLSDVAVTDPLRQWHAHKTLALVYRDAYFNQLNDRYKGKWQEYEKLADTSAANYFQIGAGLVANPIPKAGAPMVASVSGAGIEGTYYVSVAWIDEAGQEGAASDIVDVRTEAGEQIAVTAENPPAAARGWNVYVGRVPSALSRQNSSQLGAGACWTMNGDLVAGPAPSGGQQPSWFVIEQRILQRG